MFNRMSYRTNLFSIRHRHNHNNILLKIPCVTFFTLFHTYAYEHTPATTLSTTMCIIDTSTATSATTTTTATPKNYTDTTIITRYPLKRQRTTITPSPTQHH
eukprot:m.115062 g.115062  ORF g.115062 m.115062 type:complete len:102 (+) comp28395_c0_seq1:123-428(+)